MAFGCFRNNKVKGYRNESVLKAHLNGAIEKYPFLHFWGVNQRDLEKGSFVHINTETTFLNTTGFLPK